MRTIRVPSPRPDLATDLTKLWVGPGCARIGAVFGDGVQYNWAGVCWDTAAARVIWEADLQDELDCFPDPAFDRDLTRVAHRVAAGDQDAEGNDSDYLTLRDLATGSEVRLGAPGPNLCAFTPDGCHVVGSATSGTGQGELRRWPANGKPRSTRRGAARVLVAPDPAWAVRLPRPRGGLVGRMNANPTALGVSPDGRFAALGKYDGSVSVWNLSTSRVAAQIPAAKATRFVRLSAYRVRFSPDGSRIAVTRGRLTPGRGLGVSVWSVPGGSAEKGPKGKVPINDAVFAPDGHTLLTARDDGRVGVWDVASWKLQREYAWKIGKVFCIAFSPDGLTCAAGGENGQVVIWDVDV